MDDSGSSVVSHSMAVVMAIMMIVASL